MSDEQNPEPIHIDEPVDFTPDCAIGAASSIDPELAEQIMADGLAIRRLEEWRMEKSNLRSIKIIIFASGWHIRLYDSTTHEWSEHTEPTLTEAVDAALKAWEGET